MRHSLLMPRSKNLPLCAVVQYSDVGVGGHGVGRGHCLAAAANSFKIHCHLGVRRGLVCPTPLTQLILASADRAAAGD